MELILNDLDFCDENNRVIISNTPDKFLRMEFLLYQNGVNKEVIEDILNFIKICVSKGYDIYRKDIKGILAACVYLHLENKKLGCSQKDIADQFNSNPITLRMRCHEIEQFIPENSNFTKFNIGEGIIKKRRNELKHFSPRKKNLNELNLTTDKKKAIISDLNQVIEKFEEEGNTEFELGALLSYDFQSAINKQIEEIQKNHEEIPYDILNKDMFFTRLIEKQKVREVIFSLLDNIAHKHPQLDSNLLLKFLKLVLDLRDFALGGNMKAISERHNVRKGYIQTIGKLVFSNMNEMSLYMTRFYSSRYLDYDILLISQNVINGQITEDNFTNLTNPQFQELLRHYQEEKNKPDDFAVFSGVKIDLEFIIWFYKLDQNRINQILEKYDNKLTYSDLVVLCSIINKNLEILKFIVYTLIETRHSLDYISQISGKSLYAIKRCQTLIFEEKIALEDYL